MTVESASKNLDSQLLQGPILSVSDPVATLFQCEGNIFLAIVQVNDICIDHESVLEIRMELLLESIVSVQFQVYQFVESYIKTTLTMTMPIGNGIVRWKLLF